MAPASIPRTARTLAVAALAVGLAAGCASDTESGGARLDQADSWSSVAGGPANPGRAHGVVDESPGLVWSRSLGAPASGVASSDGIGSFFQTTVSDSGCNVWALSADDGRKRWCMRMATDGTRITATVDGRGSLFVPLHGGVGAVSREGQNRWFAATRGVPTTVTLLDNQHLLLISHKGAARVINTHTGLDVTPEMHIAGDLPPGGTAYGLPWCGIGERGCPVPGPAAVDTGSATAYLTAWTPGADEPELVAVGFTGGERPVLEILWRVPLPHGRTGVPVVLSDDRDEVYVHGDDGHLAAFSTADGASLWSTSVGYEPDTPPAVLTGGTIVTGGRTTTVWRGPDDDHATDPGPAPVVAIDPGDGDAAEVWRREDLQQLTNPAATGDGRVVVAVRAEGDASGDDADASDDADEPGIALHVLDGSDGATLHRIVVPAATGPVSGLSVDSDGRIALTTAMGAVYVYE